MARQDPSSSIHYPREREVVEFVGNFLRPSSSSPILRAHPLFA